MATERKRAHRTATVGLIAAIISVWPIIFTAVLWALAQWGPGGGEFSLAPRDTSHNVILLIIGLALAFACAVAAIVISIITLSRRAGGKGRAVASLVLGILGFAATVPLIVLGSVFWFSRGGPEKKLTHEQEIAKCRENQRIIATALGPEMWGYDHPDAKPEDLKKLDLSPKGDLVENDTGIRYVNDPTVLDCPADDDPDDTDYAVEITPEGTIKVRCIDPKGVEEKHNP